VTAPVEGSGSIPGRREARRHPVPDARVLEESVQQEDDPLALTPFDEMESEPAPADHEALARRHTGNVYGGGSHGDRSAGYGPGGAGRRRAVVLGESGQGVGREVLPRVLAHLDDRVRRLPAVALRRPARRPRQPARHVGDLRPALDRTATSLRLRWTPLV